MGQVSTNVYGVIPGQDDPKWMKMKTVWDSCEAAGVEPPDEVNKFFGWEPPDPSGILVDLTVHESRPDMQIWYEVRLDEIPEHVKVIRFVNSW